MKTLHTFLLSLALFCGPTCYSQADTTVTNQLVRALTAKTPIIEAKELLLTSEWEALSYWEVNDPPVFDYLYEAVPDVYEFNKGTFVIKLVDPEYFRRFGTIIEGTWAWSGNDLLVYPNNGRSSQKWEVIYLSKDYLVLEIEDLRIFFTHERSYLMENE